MERVSDEKMRILSTVVEDKIDLNFVLKFDVITIKILQKFYGKEIDPLTTDLNSFDLKKLHKLLEIEGLKINIETLRKRLDNLVSLGFLEKVSTYPRIYMAVREIEKVKNIQSKITMLKSFFSIDKNVE
ncbi:MAG: hypothetical protein RMJ18_02475 [Candidatus Aenigmarchaeota archaeon]|nr:hypothetical protein [Candidatus Aenigmarchaeota archaeon]MCX7911067.1 hypothetical protein [Endomicrobiia bacterium]MDW8160257.1 hypothetical protein [Candidatus Aenigmarchaeota archaeon]